MTDLHRELEQRARIWGRRLAIQWETELKRTSPVGTGPTAGNLRKNTLARDTPGVNTVSVTATVDTPYAGFVSTGTREHVIEANRKARSGNRPGALRFQWHGKTVYFRKVTHPATDPNPWWTDAIKNLPEMSRRIWDSL